MFMETKTTANDLCCEQDVQETRSPGQEEMHPASEAGATVGPRAGFTITLHGNRGTVNGANVATVTVLSLIPFGEVWLPNAVPPAGMPWVRFIGWSFTATGPISPPHPLILVDSHMTLFARFDMNYRQMCRAQLAQEIVARVEDRSVTWRRITVNFQSARNNLTQTANWQEASRPAQSSCGTAIGGTVPLSEHLLQAILCISDRYAGTIEINALAGASSHYRNSRHYGLHPRSNLDPALPRLGMAVDFQVRNDNVAGTGVSRVSVLDFLQNEMGFLTQRNATNPNPPSRTNYRETNSVLHLEIWGRH